MGVAGLNGPLPTAPRMSRKTPSEVMRNDIGTHLREFCAKKSSLIRVNSAISHIYPHTLVTIASPKQLNGKYLQTTMGCIKKVFLAD
jgi:hypothetical protein